jgi:hypothetical protein
MLLLSEIQLLGNILYKISCGISELDLLEIVTQPVTVADRSKACTVFDRSEAVIIGSNPTQGMDVWCVYVFFWKKKKAAP